MARPRFVVCVRSAMSVMPLVMAAPPASPVASRKASSASSEGANAVAAWKATMPTTATTKSFLASTQVLRSPAGRFMSSRPTPNIAMTRPSSVAVAPKVAV